MNPPGRRIKRSAKPNKVARKKSQLPGPQGPSPDLSEPESASQLNLAEQEFRNVIEILEDRIFHHPDRPEIELRILAFLGRALGPSTQGIAKEMNISSEAAAIHLASLSQAKRVWAQPSLGVEMAWHISHEGRHFLEQRGTTD